MVQPVDNLDWPMNEHADVGRAGTAN